MRRHGPKALRGPGNKGVPAVIERRDIDGKAVRLGLTALLLSASLLLCVYGIWRNGLFTRSAWTDPGASLYVAASMATALLLLDMLARRANRAGGSRAAERR